MHMHVKETFSNWAAVISGIPQGSILGPHTIYHSLNGSSDSVNGDLQFLWR